MSADLNVITLSLDATSEPIERDVAIIGAGPCGLFAAFELGLLGLNAILIDALDKPGGQCAELYPEKPIYDIPAWPKISGQELTDKLLEQIAPFHPVFLPGQKAAQMRKTETGDFEIIPDIGARIIVKTVFIAAGAGCFVPRRPTHLENLQDFEEKSFFYCVRDRASFGGKKTLIIGGGDSALDWAIDLTKISEEVILMHRRDKFRAAPHSVASMRALEEAGRIRFIQGELSELRGKNGQIDEIIVKKTNAEGGEESLSIDRALAFFGLNVELGALSEWNLKLHEDKQIIVDTEKFETSVPGVFAIGDINWYPGKLKLILSVFHESALASQAAFKIARPDEKLIFRYTTSSTDLQKKLGVKE